MIEKNVYDFLKKKYSVYLERPVNPPSEYLIIEKTNGGVENMIEYATITVQSYATTLYNAAKLNESVCEYMEQITEDSAVMSCNLNGNYNYTDPSTKEYRYQAVFNIRML